MALNKSVATTARLFIVCNLPDLPTSLVVPLDVPGIERPLPARALRRARSEHQHVLNRQVIVRRLAARLGLVFRGDVVLAAGQRRHFERHLAAVAVWYGVVDEGDGAVDVRVFVSSILGTSRAATMHRRSFQ